ncbi:hypothetical protein [Bradyrhizobium sp. UFLA05-112]
MSIADIISRCGVDQSPAAAIEGHEGDRLSSLDLKDHVIAATLE